VVRACQNRPNSHSIQLDQHQTPYTDGEPEIPVFVGFLQLAQAASRSDNSPPYDELLEPPLIGALVPKPLIAKEPNPLLSWYQKRVIRSPGTDQME